MHNMHTGNHRRTVQHLRITAAIDVICRGHRPEERSRMGRRAFLRAQYRAPAGRGAYTRGGAAVVRVGRSGLFPTANGKARITINPHGPDGCRVLNDLARA